MYSLYYNKTHMCAPANVSFGAESVGKSASQIGRIIDMRDTACFLLNINTVAFFDNSSTTEIQ